MYGKTISRFPLGVCPCYHPLTMTGDGASAPERFGFEGETFREPGFVRLVEILRSRGKEQRVSELRLETVYPEERHDEVIAALRAAHPYEEPAFDIYPLL